MNKLLNKVVKSNFILTLFPCLISLLYMLNLYSFNYKMSVMNEILFKDAFLFCIVFTCILLVFKLVLSFILKNKQKEYVVLTIMAILLICNIKFYFIVIIFLILIFIFKKFVNFNLSYIILFSMCFIIIFSIGTLNSSISKYIHSINNTLSYKYKFNLKVDKTKSSPNIYWIHCDGMMSLDDMKKYFNYDNEELKEYLNNNNYYVNSNVRMSLNHHTNTALVALFNPIYYDNFFKNYLDNLDKRYLTGSDSIKKIVNYDELKDRRLNNEMFKALDYKGYTTYAIAGFNQYTSFYTDYYYDYYKGTKKQNNDNRNGDNFKLIKKGDNSYNLVSKETDINHLNSLFDRTSIQDIVKNVNILNYKNVNYNDVSIPNDGVYKAKIVKKIFKGLNDSFKDKNNKFVFVDYGIDHLPILYDKNGKYVSDDKYYDLDYYVDNYIYSTKALISILNYIKDNDGDSIIVVQGDHGIHILDDKYLKDYFNTDNQGALNIKNSTMSAIYVPEKYRNSSDKYLNNPFNFSRYIVNNYVGNNYKYIK